MCESSNEFHSRFVTTGEAVERLKKRGIKHCAQSLNLVARRPDSGLRSVLISGVRLFWSEDLDRFSPVRTKPEIKIEPLKRRSKTA